MHIISKKKWKEFWAEYPDAEPGLKNWHRVTEKANWKCFADVRLVYGNADQIDGKFTIFNIGGNKYRLITAIHFNTGRVYIRRIMTHKEYDKGEWKKD